MRRWTTIGARWALAGALATALLLAVAPAPVSGAGGDTITQPPAQYVAPGGSQTLTDQILHLDAAPPAGDILLAIDTTSSMGGAIADARADAASIVSRIKAAIPGARFAVANFRDYPFSPFGVAPGEGGTSEDYPWQRNIDFTADQAAVQAALNGVSACSFCGNDLPEAYNRAFYEASLSPSDSAWRAADDLSWAANTPRFMVVLGDSYGHDPNQAADFGPPFNGEVTPPPNCPATANRDPGRDGVEGNGDDLGTLPALTALRDAGTNLSFVTYNPTSGPASKVACHLALSTFTGGTAVTHSDSTASLGDQIVSLINDAAAQIDRVTFDVSQVSGPATNASSWFSFFPPLPYGPTLAPTNLNFDETITAPQTAAVGQYVFQVRAFADGGLRATQTVTVNVVQGTNPHLSVDEQTLPAGIALAPFNKIPASRIPFFSGSTTAATPYGATPYGATPFGATPFGATPYGATPWGATPYGATPYGATPYGATPFGATPWGATPWGATGLGPSPFGATPYGATDLRNPLNQIFLSQIPLTNPASGATWPQVLGNSPLAAAPLSATTLGAVARDTTLGADNKTPWQRFSALPAKDVPFLSSLWQGIPVGAIVLGTAKLSEIPNPSDPSATTPAARAASWATTIQQRGGCAGCTSADNTFFGIAAAGALGSTDIGAIPYGATPYGATAGGAIALKTMNIAGSRFAPVPLSEISTLADIVDCGAFACAGKTLGDVPASAFKSTATLAKLLDGLQGSTNPAAVTARAITVDEIVAAILPFTMYPWEQISVQGLQDVVGTGKNAHYHVDFDLSCSTTAYKVDVDLPNGFFPVPGSTTVAYAGGAAQAIADPTLVFQSERALGSGFRATVVGTAPACAAATRSVRLSFTAFTGLELGDQLSTARVTALGKTETAPEHAPVLVTENQEPNNDPASAPEIGSDQLVVGHVASSGDDEYYRFPLSSLKPYSRVVVSMKVPHGADFDLTLNAPAQPPVESTPFGATSLSAPPVPDQAVKPDNSDVAPQANTLSDIPFGATPWGATSSAAAAPGSVSQNRGSDPESAAIVVNQASGYLTIGVSGYEGSFSADPYVLRLQVLPPPPLPQCPARTGLSTPAAGTKLPAASSLPADAKTLFLVNRQRLAGLYGAAAADSLVNNDATSPLNQLALRPEVNGTVVTVDANQNVRSAYAGWDADPCSPSAANAVVRSINDVVAAYRAARPSLKYIVLLGTDTAVPMYRQPDKTLLAPELDYAQGLAFTTIDPANPSVPYAKGNSLYASAAQNNVLTDGAYAAFTKIPWDDHDLPLPQISVSRLVESPSDILGQVNQYLSSQGLLNANSALTTGYDFLADGADETNAALADAVRLPGAGGTGLSRNTLISPNHATTGLWTKDDIVSQFFGASPVPDIAAVFAHYNHFALKPAGPEAVTDLSQVPTTANVPSATPGLPGHLIFTVGCHSGLSVGDELGRSSASAGDAPMYVDWPQAYNRAVYVANTGFGYGDTLTVAASERLMALFAKNLNAGSSVIGDNWVNALTTYFLSTGIYSAVDEKVMLEATFYGLPFYHFGTAPTQLPAGGTPPTSDGVVESSSYSPSTTSGRTRHDVDGTTFWSGSGGTIAVPYRSIQPLVTKNVSVAGKQGRGAWVTAMKTEDVPNITPAIANWSFDTALPKPNFENVFWPASPVELQHATTAGGVDRSILNVNAGSFHPTGGTTGDERLIDSIGVDVTYSSAADQVNPLISEAGSVQDPDDASKATIFARVTDNSGSLHKVAALYNDGTENGDGTVTWTYVALSPQGGGLYTAVVSGLSGLIELGVEAMDNAGNVGQSWNKAFNFHEVVDNSGNGPEIVASNPLPGQTYLLNEQVKPVVDCSDVGGVASCTATPLVNGNLDTRTVGPHTLIVQATDLSGNETDRPIPYKVVYKFQGFDSPVDNPPILNLVNAGATIPIKWAILDANGVRVNSLSTIHSISSQALKCPSATTDPDPSQVPLGTEGLKIDDSGYRYNWATPKTWAGSCRRLIIHLADDQIRYADFKFK